MAKGKFYIGTSGWHYKHWKGNFYPVELKADDHFPFYQKKFDTVEINNSFYRLPSAETFARWRKESPKDFVFVIKGSRYTTHQKKIERSNGVIPAVFRSCKTPERETWCDTFSASTHVEGKRGAFCSISQGFTT